MRRIGDQHRQVLVETYYRGRPYAEVAAELGSPGGHGEEPRLLRAAGSAGRARGDRAMKAEGCREWRESLGAYALGHLPDEERAGLEAHLEGCPSCRAGARVALVGCRADVARRPGPLRVARRRRPPSLADRVAAAIGRERAPRRRRRVSAWPSAARQRGGAARAGASSSCPAAADGGPEQHVTFALAADRDEDLREADPARLSAPRSTCT